MFLFASQAIRAQTLAFPGAQGFGQFATGGRTGTVYHVTSLGDSGTGTFRDAVSQPNRCIVFDVGGTITLASAVTCSSDLTIAGQTAPGGIAIIGHEVSMSVRTNEIVRYLRIRPGSIAASTEDGINMGDGTNLIFDHVSVEFAPYNNIDAHGNYTDGTLISFQNSILADPIGQQFNAHTESLYNTFSWNNDILSSAHNRNPLAKVNTIFVNNVVYNYQAGYTVADTSGNFSHDIVNNYFIPGPSTSNAGDDFFQMDSNQKIYSTGNLLNNTAGTLGGSTATPGGVTVLSSAWSPATATIPTVSTTAAYKYDASLSGALPRDQVDQLVIKDVTSLGTSGQMWTSQTATGLGNNGYGSITGGATPLNTSGDGIADYWKLANGLNVNTAYPLTIQSDGYTLLEHYLNWLGGLHAATGTNTPVNVDLSQYAAGFAASATYTVNNGSNGTVTLNGHVAQFTPAANFFGLGSFSFVVNDGDAMTNTVVVCISSIPPPLDLTWHGDGGANDWDITSTNWLFGTNREVFVQNDTVTFDNSGSNNTPLNLTGTLTPAAISIPATQNYTFSGTGNISGSALLTKSGSGTLTVNTTNSSYAGNILLNSGTLVLGSGASVGTGTITMNTGTILGLSANNTISPSNPIMVGIGQSATITNVGIGNGFYGAFTSGDANSVLNLSNSMSFEGTTTNQFNGFIGTINIANGSTLRFVATSNLIGSLNPSWIINGTMQPRNAGNTILLGALSGSGQLAGPQTFTAGWTGNTAYTIGGNNLSSIFGGTIVSNANSTNTLICLNKVGTGTLTLSGNNTAGGTNSVQAGTLILNGSNWNYLTTVYSGATLSGTGVLNGALSVAGGGILTPGNNGSGTLTVNGALTNNAPTLNFNLSNSPAGANGLIRMTGPLYLAGVQTCNFNLAGGPLANGVYPLITGGSSTTLSGVSYAENLPAGARQTFTFTNPASGSSTGLVSLVVAGSPAAALVWQGTNGSSWDTSTTNWLNNTSADKFYNLDAVTFSDGSTNGTVNLAGALQPAQVSAVNSATTYTLNGPGSLAGAMQLGQAGAGNFILNNTNTFSGGILALAGEVTLNYPASAGTGPLLFGNGAVNFNGPALSTYTNAMTFLADGTVISTGGGNNTVSSAWLGTNVTVNMSIPSGTFSVTGPMSGLSGTMAFGGSSGSFRFNLGTPSTYDASHLAFDLGTNTATLLNRNGNTTITLGSLAGGPNTTLSGAGSVTNFPSVYNIGSNNLSTTFAGTIKDGTPVTAQTFVVKIGTGTWTLTGSSTFGGGLTVSQGTLCANSTSGSAVGVGPLEVQGGATLTGTGIIGGPATMDDYSVFAPGNPTGTLTFTNGLTFNDNSILEYTLGSSSDAAAVTGDLFLDGGLQVAAGGNFGPGAYTLFTYTGLLTVNNFRITSVPAGYLCALNTNNAGQVQLVVTVPAPPAFGNITLGGSGLVLNGTGGPPNGTYYVLGSTNLMNWAPLLTNQFDASGNFNFTNTINAGAVPAFYRLELP